MYKTLEPLMALIRSTIGQMNDRVERIADEAAAGDPDEARRKVVTEYGPVMIGLLDLLEKVEEFEATGTYYLGDFVRE